MALLDINNIQVTYDGSALALSGFSLRVGEGAITALLGANGSGKSTALKAVSGMLRTEKGRVSRGFIQYDGQMIHNLDPADIVRRGVFQAMEGRRVFRELTVEENLLVASRAGTRAVERKRFDMAYSYFPVLQTRRRQPAGYLSGGERQMLVIGQALMAGPRLLLLDEPSTGLAPMIVEELFGVIERLNREEKVTILLVEQNADIALSVAHYGYVTEAGRVVFRDTAERLRADDRMRRFYLGHASWTERKV